MMEKKFLPRLNSKKNDLSKRWYVSYIDRRGNRVRVSSKINRHNTVRARLKAADELIKELTRKIYRQKYKDILSKIAKRLENSRHIYRHKTYQTYKSKFDIFEEYICEHGLSQESIESFFLEYLTVQRRLKPKTYNSYVVVIGQFLEWIGERDLIRTIKKRKGESQPASYYTDTQKRFLIKHIQEKDEGLYLFIQLMYYCFLRPGEIRLLRVGDVILEEQKIVVTGDVSKNKKQQYISIPDVFFPTLQRELAGRNPSGYIFYSKGINTPIGTNTMAAKHRKILTELYFDKSRYKLYSWKHTGAVAAVKAGIHIKQLQIQLRHHSLDQVDMYLRQLGVQDLGDLQTKFPRI